MTFSIITAIILIVLIINQKQLVFKIYTLKPVVDKKYNIAVAGTGYVGLSIATLLSQHNHVTAVDIIPEKVDLINNRKSPIQDDYIEMYLAEKDLDLTAINFSSKSFSPGRSPKYVK